MIRQKRQVVRPKRAARILVLLASVLLVITLVTAPWKTLFETVSTDAPDSTLITPTGPDDLTPYVNPFLGTAPGGAHFGFTGNSGNVFPGATVPLGMVQFSPDTDSRLPGGYNYLDTHITGLSVTHFSGRGCSVYQDVAFMPYVGRLLVSPGLTPYTSRFSHHGEEAYPGYYRVHLDGANVTAELTTTQRTGLARFSFPPSPRATLLINTSGSVNGVSASSAKIDPARREITGQVTSQVGCGRQPYTLYFAAQFDHPLADFGTWNAHVVLSQTTHASGAHTGAFVVFNTSTDAHIQARVGISFVSVAHALANLGAEESSWDFEAVRDAARSTWNAMLGRIRVQGGTREERIAFYTALYHVYFHPNLFNDSNGSYLGFDGRVHTLPAGHAHYANIPGWDSYRSLMPLRALLDPTEASDIAQSLVDDATQGDGHLPRWEQANVDSEGMIGDSADVLLADIYAYGGTNFDTTAALHAMRTGQARIREGLPSYHALGYVAADSVAQSAAITLEYSADNFAIAQFAQALDNTQVAQTYQRRSNNWRNIFNPATGYVQPRNVTGAWATDFRPEGRDGFIEGSAAQYTWMVPFDLHGLIERMGGAQLATQRLDGFFTQLNDGPTSPYAFMGNEPCLSVPWIYDFTGAPAKTQAIVRVIQRELFKSTPDGLPGNDDGGALSAWYIFSVIGLYPEIPGVAGFVIGSPLFPSVTLHLGNGHTLHINAPDATENRPYVQGMRG